MIRLYTASRPWLSLVLLLLALVPWFLPRQLSANEDGLYLTSTGHHLTNEHGFLRYWQQNHGDRFFGPPVTEPLQEQGVTVQYFTHARFEAHLDAEGQPVVQLGRIGVDYTNTLWRTFPAASAGIAGPDAQFFADTGHTLAPPFLDFWYTHGGATTLGYPISEMIWEYVDQQMLPVQYFERGRLEHHPLQAGHADEVQISALGKELAQLRNLPTAPVPAATTLEVATVAEAMHPDVLAQSIGPEVTEADSAATDGSLPDLAEAEAATASEPLAAASAAVIDTSDSTTAAEEWVEPYQQPSPLWSSGGNKHIEISIGGQWLYAYEDGLLVFDAPISTGRDGFNTPMGSYSIYAKVPVETMSGTLGGEYYYVPNVPSVMYINGGVAMHGTYWHSQFGTGVRMSHGCVNLPMASASWLYGWAPVGTPVLVY